MWLRALRAATWSLVSSDANVGPGTELLLLLLLAVVVAVAARDFSMPGSFQQCTFR